MVFWSTLLSLLAVLFVNMMFVFAMIHYSFEPRWLASYFAVILLYASLYFRRFRHLPAELRRRLGNAAITLGAFLSAFFFYNFAPGMSWWIAGAAWLGLAAAAYFVYDVVMFDDDEEAQVQIRPQV